MDGSRKKTPVWPFVLAGVILVAGIGGAGYLFITGILGIDDALIRIQAPGSYDLELEKSGAYTIFLESGNVDNGAYFGAPSDANGLSVRIEAPNGESLSVGASTTNSTYSLNGREGRSIMQFNVEQPGRYRVITEFPGQNRNQSVTLTMAAGFGFKIAGTILGAIALFIGSLVAAVLIVVLTLVFRNTGPRVQA